jgi:hypothetical protein
MTAVEQARELPVVNLTKNKRIKIQVQKEYYESKIECLIGMNLPIKLVLLACWDSPVERENLDTSRGQQRFIKKCLKYYRKRLKEIEREEKRLR